ncbi:hypothetical protein FACS1894104_5350 [Actinomycetota bacterium]|nr:hypothetical protein FACS1894104_5350 [Actinomycetota bacterium]
MTVLVAGWLDKLGYAISIKENPIKNIDNSKAFSINGFGKMLANLDTDNYDYLAVHRYFKQLIESYSINPRPIAISVLPSRIKNSNWRAFYAAAVAYLSNSIGQTTPSRFSGKSNRLKQQWSPIKRLGKSHTDFDSTFALYNVLLPKGELKWI